ncbi:MAG: PorV/PorQ family protein, partial [Elusimicrobia bacterium]|nr:PorV/PorQ family protein [Elusimicrobiota bacterium]
INTIFWNPAGLSQLRQSQLSFMHNEGLVNTQYEFLGFAHPTEEMGTVAASIIYLHQGKIVQRSVNGYTTGDFISYDTAFNFSYGNNVSKTLSFGFNLKLIKQQIAHISASGMAFDFGTLYQTPIENLNISATLQNAGPGITFVQEETPLPTKLSFGVAYNIKGLILAADFNLPRDAQPYFNIGTECLFGEIFALRSGLISQKDLAVPTALSYGFGLQYNNYGLDYAFLPFGELGNTHRISMNFKFGSR